MTDPASPNQIPKQTGSRILVYGATGYTGRQIVQELQRQGQPLALGGRSRIRLEGLKNELKLPLDVPVIVADPLDPSSLSKLFPPEVAIMVNCAGPFTLLGEPVVRAALEAGVHYLDISGEQGYLAGIVSQYDQAAKQKGVAILPDCGFEFAMTNWAGALAVQSLEPVEELWTATVASDIQTSRGTQLSLFQALSKPGISWQKGAARRKLTASSARKIKFPPPFGKRRAIWAPFGETVTLPRHLQIQNLHSFFVVSTPLGYTLSLFAPILPPISRLFGSLVKPFIHQPSSYKKDDSQWAMIAEAKSAQGTRRVILQGTGVYYLTSIIIGWCVTQLLKPDFKQAGVLGPAQAFEATEALEYLKDFDLKYEVISL